MADLSNPLLRDRDVDFILYEALDAASLCALPAFADHDRGTFDLFLQSARRLARDVLYPAYRAMDQEPARFDGRRVQVHPAMRSIYPRLVELGILSASRPAEKGGQSLPFTIATVASAYLMAANLSAYGFIGLTHGAAHLVDTFGDERLKAEFAERLYAGEWTGTMALTEPQAGSSLTDVMTKARPTSEGYHLITGSKIFISGGDHDITENVVNMTLARIEGAPPGIKGVSLFAIPNRRHEGGELVDNDVSVAGAIHKIGWRGLPSLALNFGERGDCRGWLVGEPNRGISYMFQMMNGARIMVGVNGVATASVAYHEALAYARVRPQGRPLSAKNPLSPQVPIIEHADVRRMLLRQKAIVEGGLSLLATTALYADWAEHAATEAERRRARLLLDLLTPVAKSFPAEKGFESNALALQIHGGYGYSSEYLPEAWLRDQKLNSIHEGTTGIQGMDLLGRKVVAEGGLALQLFAAEIESAAARASRAGVDEAMIAALRGAVADVGGLTMHLGSLGMRGDVEAMMLHSSDYLELFSVVTIAWQWLVQAAAAREGIARGAGPEGVDFYEGKLRAASYWFATELPRVAALSELCRSGEGSYGSMKSDWF